LHRTYSRSLSGCIGHGFLLVDDYCCIEEKTSFFLPGLGKNTKGELHKI
jgi:hypothetical protein